MQDLYPKFIFVDETDGMLLFRIEGTEKFVALNMTQVAALSQHTPVDELTVINLIQDVRNTIVSALLESEDSHHRRGPTGPVAGPVPGPTHPAKAQPGPAQAGQAPTQQPTPDPTPVAAPTPEPVVDKTAESVKYPEGSAKQPESFDEELADLGIDLRGGRTDSHPFSSTTTVE